MWVTEWPTGGFCLTFGRPKVRCNKRKSAHRQVLSPYPRPKPLFLTLIETRESTRER